MDKITVASTSIKEKLKKALDATGISQAELARRLGCDKTTISHYVSGDRMPRADFLVAICNELNISLDYFLTDQSQNFTIKNEQIPTTDRDVLLSIAILMKRNIIQIDDRNGGIWVTSPNNDITEFLYEVDRYKDSKYAKVDTVILSIIDKTIEELNTTPLFEEDFPF